MRKGNYTREEAIEKAGLAAVEAVEKENCDFTNRLQCDGDDAVEFSASVEFRNDDFENQTLTAYYYQYPKDLDCCDDLGNLDWEVSGYEIV